MLNKHATVLLWAVVFLCAGVSTGATDKSSDSGVVVETEVVKFTGRLQHDVIAPEAESAVEINFRLDEGWHFYADEKAAPGGMNLKIKISTEGDYLDFSEVIYPGSEKYKDPLTGGDIDVFSGDFSVYIPFRSLKDIEQDSVESPVQIILEGALCSETQCRMFNPQPLKMQLRIERGAVMEAGRFFLPGPVTGKEQRRADGAAGLDYGFWFAIGLAILAGLLLNIMPCIWPVLPIIVLRIVQQANENKTRSFILGLCFCGGMLLFFASLAGVNIVLQVFYGEVLQWGDQFRSPIFVAAMAMLLVVLAMFMFGIFTINVPGTVSEKAGSGSGLAGAVGTGFLVAILGTPCSFGILAAAFAWAQAQHWSVASVVIISIGVGMALPYAILTSMPGLLKRLPKPGRWMEIFKQGLGFLLLGIAMWLIGALPGKLRMDVLYFSVVLGFCVWIWAGWVRFDTPAVRKWIIRALAAGLIAVSGIILFTPDLIKWQNYDEASIDKALKNGQPVLIKFTAGWCGSCKIVDWLVYSREDVAELIKQKGVLAIKADTTVGDYPVTQILKEKYHEPGLPVSMLFVPGVDEPIRWRGKAFVDKLKEELQKLP